MESPRFFSSLATRTWPQAGCSMATSITARSISGSVRFFRQGLKAADLLKGNLAAFLVQLLKRIKAVAVVAIILQAWLTLPSCFASSQRPALARMIFCSLVISWSPSPPVGGPNPGANLTPPTWSVLGKPTLIVRFKSELVQLQRRRPVFDSVPPGIGPSTSSH